MERIKWFEVHWSSNYENVSKNIIANKFSDNKQYGFKVYKRRDDHINASYIEIKEIEEEVENPLTNELTVYKRVLFCNVPLCQDHLTQHSYFPNL